MSQLLLNIRELRIKLVPPLFLSLLQIGLEHLGHSSLSVVMVIPTQTYNQIYGCGTRTDMLLLVSFVNRFSHTLQAFDPFIRSARIDKADIARRGSGKKHVFLGYKLGVTWSDRSQVPV